MNLVITGKLLGKFAVTLGVLSALLASACDGQAGPPRQPPTKPPAAVARCSGDDHSLEEISLGWSFCYPSRWHYREKFQPSNAPRGVDTTLDVVVVSPTPGPDQGEFGFMIIGSYERAGAADLPGWLATNVGDGLILEPISWGNSQSAVKVEGQTRRFALTADRVFELDVHQGDGNLALDSAMAQRLANWHFGV